ncbi:MAG: hypothetical protein H8E44_39870 [Planctomycetes bacterium]|nr:hypothetical protein [Planctomycetota bacterium]
MDAENNQFRDLCNAVVAGAGDATQRFRHAILPHLRIIVKRSLRLNRRGLTSGPHHRDVGLRSSAAGSRLVGRNDEALVDHKARQLCEALIDSLRSLHGRPTNETIVDSLLHRTLNLGAIEI